MKILCLDDEKDILEILQFDLELAGHVVITFSSGHQAAEYLAADAVDVILTDVRMPQMNGIEFVQKIRAMHIETPVVLLTAYAELNSGTLEDLRIIGTLAKPCSGEELSALLKRASLNKQ